MTPLRVLYTIPNFDTAGSGKALLKIAARLDSARFEPHICCMHDRGALFEVVRRSGIPIHLFPYTADMSKRLKGLVHVWRTARFFRRIQPDIIHSFHYAADYSEALAARLAGAKWVYSKKNMNWGGASKNAWHLRSWLANGIVAQNTDMLREFFPNWKKATLIPRGVDTSEFQPVQHQSCDDHPLSGAFQWIVCVANLVPVKGVEVLFDAYRKIASDFPKVHLAVVGDDRGKYPEQLKSDFQDLIEGGQLVFTGKVLNVRDYLRQAVLFVLPTRKEGRKEGSPVSLLEAMASGVPVLGSHIPGIRDQLANFPDLLFEPGNSTELAQKMKTLLEMPGDGRSKLGIQLRREVEDRFTIEREVQQHEQFYASLYR